jgi:hypothetical protein
LQEQQKEGEGMFIKFLPFLKYLISRQKEAEVNVIGGWMRVATVLFNSKKVEELHPLTKDLDLQKKHLKELKQADYTGSGQWLPAFQKCHEMISGDDSKAINGSRRFCVIIGDNEAMCQKNTSAAFNELKGVFGDLDDDLFDFGDDEDISDVLVYPD